MQTKNIEVGHLYINKFRETIRVTAPLVGRPGWFSYEKVMTTGEVHTAPYMHTHARAIVEKLSPKEG